MVTVPATVVTDEAAACTVIAGMVTTFTLTTLATVTANEGGETPTSGTATLTNDTRSEINTEGFGYIALEIVSTGATWSINGVVAQAYNGTAPANVDIFAPAGIRYRHSSDTSVEPTTALNNIYYNLGIGPPVGNGYGTNLTRVDGSNTGFLVLPTTGTRYFLFDLNTSSFAIRPFFTAGTAVLKYRLYKGKHPFFSARNVIVRGENADGKINVTVPDGINANVVYAIQDGEGTTFGVDRDFPISGTVTAFISNAQAELGENAPSQAVQIAGYNLADNKIYPFNVDSDGIQRVEARPLQSSSASITTFTETTSSTVLAASATRKGIVFFVSGAGSAFISLGDVTTSTSAYSIVVSENDVANITGYTGDITGLVTGDAVLHVTSLS
jgi:hypothetical protein